MFKQVVKRFSAFAHDRNGSPAIECALIAPLFFAGVFGTFELGRGLYERNQFAAAAALATRQVALNPEVTEDELKDLIADEMGHHLNDLTIDVEDSAREIAGQKFKELTISYEFKFLVNLGHNFDSVELNTTRYIPIDPNADDDEGNVVNF